MRFGEGCVEKARKQTQEPTCKNGKWGIHRGVWLSVKSLDAARAAAPPHSKLSEGKAGVILVYSRRVREACWACYI